MQIHVSREGKSYGPYSVGEANAYLQSGELSANDLAWFEGAAGWIPLRQIPEIECPAMLPPPLPAHGVPSHYHHVAVWKFALLSILTVGTYDIIWFYKNWKFIKERDGSDIMPFWRAIFGVLWCFPLAKDIRQHSPEPAPGYLGALPLAYLAFHLCWKLPEPWWLISMFSFIPLAVLVLQVHRINSTRGSRAPYYGRIGLGAVTGMVVGALVLVMAVASSFHWIVPSRVVTGEEIRPADLRFLRAEGMLEDGELPLYFYSIGIFSVADEGNLLTDRRVVSYFRLPFESARLLISSATFEEIHQIETTYSDSALEDSEVFVQTSADADDGFYLSLSSEEGGDRTFVNRLTELWNEARHKKEATGEDGPPAGAPAAVGEAVTPLEVEPAPVGPGAD